MGKLGLETGEPQLHGITNTVCNVVFENRRCKIVADLWRDAKIVRKEKKKF